MIWMVSVIGFHSKIRNNHYIDYIEPSTTKTSSQKSKLWESIAHHVILSAF